MVPPKSQTTESPTCTTRSPGSWWGLAAFGPEATMAKLARSWPPSSMRSTSSREMSASVRPAKGRSRIASATESTTRAAARRASTSAASFWARSGPVTVDAAVNFVAGKAS